MQKVDVASTALDNFLVIVLCLVIVLDKIFSHRVLPVKPATSSVL